MKKIIITSLLLCTFANTSVFADQAAYIEKAQALKVTVKQNRNWSA